LHYVQNRLNNESNSLNQISLVEKDLPPSTMRDLAIIFSGKSKETCHTTHVSYYSE